MSLQLWKKKMAIIAAMNKGYLLDVSGNPAVLTNALKKPLQGVTVYGASGGVGDSDLPSGYVRLEYIESTGTQYIDTGVTGGGNFGIEADVYIGSLPTDGYYGVFGSKAANRDRESTLYYSANLNSWNGSVRTSSSMENAQLSPNTRTTVSLRGSVFSHDDVSFSVSRGNNNTYPVTLFAVNNAGAVSQFGSFKLYSCKIYTGSTLVRDMVPAKRESDNAIGMYDMLNDTFYADAAGGNFVAGREIYRIPVLLGDVPAGYTQLEYIESTGTQYIDTGVSYGNTIVIRDKIAYSSLDDKTVIYQINGVQATTYWGIKNTQGTGIWLWSCGGSNTVYSASANQIYDVVCNISERRLYVNDELVDERRSADSGSGNMYLFAVKGGSQTTPNFFEKATKRYETKIYDNTVLVRDFIPVKRNNDGEIGMYDTVTGTFYTNSGTGDFVAGAEIVNKTTNLYAPQQLTAAADTFAADIAALTATFTAGGVSTDISAMQDWEQDFTLAKGDNTVSVGTTVQPSAVEWRYLSYSRGE